VITDVQGFAEEWITTWNSHDMDQILEHYADDFEIITPMIRMSTSIDADSLKGKKDIRAYWEAALKKIPDLRFELEDIAVGVHSVALYYTVAAVGKKTVEVMFFNEKGKVEKVIAHYTSV